MQLEIETQIDQFSYFPGTRYMGSKNKIIDIIGKLLANYDFETFLDAFAGSNVVAYYMKTRGKGVFTNDFMAISHITSKAIIENSDTVINEKELSFLINNKNDNNFISETFNGLYFSDSDNQFLDQVRGNIDLIENEYKKSIALASLVRSCMKKRPRGIFTFIGHRYDDGRNDIKKSIKDHFIENVSIFNNSVFNNQKECKSYNYRTEELKLNADLVYFDPPYYTPNSDNDYVRRYHFVEGLVKNWVGLDLQNHTKTKKFESYKSPFANKLNAYQEFDNLICKFQNSIIAISYSSNSLPNKNEMIEILEKYKSKVIVYEMDHLYSFGNQSHKAGNGANRVKEYLFIGIN